MPLQKSEIPRMQMAELMAHHLIIYLYRKEIIYCQILGMLSVIH